MVNQACLLIKILILMKETQVLLHPDLATVSFGRWGKKWPEGGSINYNTILQLGMFCKKEGKWTEVPYIQLFPKSLPKMAEQMQARYTDHGDSLQKAPKFT
jgi:hypothetical protein